MLRFGTLLCFAMAVLGQVPEKAAYVSLETTANGELNATLAGPISPLPAGLPEAFAHAVGCGSPNSDRPSYDSRILVHCAERRPSRLTFHAEIRLAELMPLLLQVGITRLDLTLAAAHFPVLHLDPPLPSEGRRSSGYYHTQYSFDRIPQQIVIDGGFEIRQVWTLAAAALGFVLAPFLLLLLRPRDPLRLRVQMEGIFVLGWTCWIWVLLRVEAGTLLSYLLGQWTVGPLLVVLAPSLVAVWIGSRLAAREYARLTPNGVDAGYYRRLRFWSGAAATCLASTILTPLLTTLTNGPWSILAGFVLAVACLLRIRSIGRGGSRAISQGDLRHRAFALAAKAGVNLRGVSLLTSPTPRPPVALATRWGVVLLNQSLLSSLSRREVDAILCHEFSHLHPVNKSALYPVYVLVVGSILASQWIPNFTGVIPLSILAIYFLIKAWRRAGERKADLDSVRWSGDPEAMITGLARVSRAHGMPLTWGFPISWMMAHPPTMNRMRAIARAGGLNDSRVAELLAESRLDPADHYPEEQAASIPEDAAFSPALRQRLQSWLTVYVLVAPVLLGLPAVWLLQRMGMPWWGVIFAGSLTSMVAMNLGSEWLAGSIREAVRKRALARHGQGVFAGFSPSAEPRLFDGSYHYDLGMVRFVDGALEFAGDRAHFRLDRRLVQRVWLGDGPRHWTPRKLVYLECRPSPDAAPLVFSLQSFEAWFWPSTVSVAKRLYQQVDAWHRGTSSSPAPPMPCPLPQVEGNTLTYVAFRTAYRSIGIYTGIAFLLASFGSMLDPSTSFWDPSQTLCPVAVCGLLAFFLVWPRLNWGNLKTMAGSSPRLPADS
jgi:Zn-dependent protease with chaperone function